MNESISLFKDGEQTKRDDESSYSYLLSDLELEIETE